MSTSTRGPVPAGTRASAMARFKVGEKVPLVTSPERGRGSVGAHALMTAQYAALLENQAHQHVAADPAGALERLSTDEIPRFRVEGDRPRQPRLERMAAFIHIVAIEVHAGLQAQRIARAQTGRGHALRQQRPPGVRAPPAPAA